MMAERVSIVGLINHCQGFGVDVGRRERKFRRMDWGCKIPFQI